MPACTLSVFYSRVSMRTDMPTVRFTALFSAWLSLHLLFPRFTVQAFVYPLSLLNFPTRIRHDVYLEETALLASESSSHLPASLPPVVDEQQATSSSPQPRACLVDNVTDPRERQELEQTLQAVGFRVVSSQNEEDNTSIYRYRWNAATGMLQFVPTAEGTIDDFAPPRWIPRIAGEEKVLVDNGWSFLDVDESEKPSPFDAVNSGVYQPQWKKNKTQSQSCSSRWSKLGFSLEALTEVDIIEQADLLENSLSKRVLLEGVTDPPGMKETANGVNFSGSIRDVEPGVFVSAIGGLPLFTTLDLSPATASNSWLSFIRPVSPDHVQHVEPEPDSSDSRIEVVCAKSGCHLGHYFGRQDGYCINASALRFIPAVSHDSQMEEGPSMLPVSSYRALETVESTPSLSLLQNVSRQRTTATTIVFGAGCFWGIEHALRRLVGVVDTKTGYAGGTTTDPTYEMVCQQTTNHAEVVRVEFDRRVLPCRVLFDCFLALHDATKVRAHGRHAAGTGQYRSCVFVPAELEAVALDSLEQCRIQLDKDLSTEIYVMDWENIDQWFWPAEERHQRHKEKRRDCSDVELSALSAVEWLEVFGRRSKSDAESKQKLPERVDERR